MSIKNGDIPAIAMLVYQRVFATDMVCTSNFFVGGMRVY